MPTTETQNKDGFSTPPGGSKVLNSNTLKDALGEASDAKQKISNAAEILGGKLKDVPAETSVEMKIEVPKEVKEAYLRSLLSGERFEHTEELFGGAIVVTFESRLVKENTAIKQLMKAHADDDDAGVIQERMFMSQSIRSIQMKGARTINKTDLVKMVDDVPSFSFDFYDGMSDIVYCSLITAFRHFENICDTLFKNYNNGPFWTATGGATSRSERTQKAS